MVSSHHSKHRKHPMKISYSWLKTYLETTSDIQKIAEILTDIGLEVESIEKNDTIEIGLTPNRADAMSHYGVARDLHAALKIRGHEARLIPPKLHTKKKKRPPSKSSSKTPKSVYDMQASHSHKYK
ncbi:MAG: hypothetical protein ACMUEL_03805 [Flavobacteriales bacterium Tduv]